MDCVEESRVPILFRDSNEVRIERVKLPLPMEALGSIAGSLFMTVEHHRDCSHKLNTAQVTSR